MTLVARLKVTLSDVEPQVLRRFDMPLKIKLNRLHDVIQAAMGWTDSHLYEFRDGGVGWGVPDPDGYYDGPLTWYLDLRSHLAHHLSLPSMDIGRARTLKIALWFWARTLIASHYETMFAVNLALEDVLRGPDFFAQNADMSTRRAQLGALRKVENWQTMPKAPTERRKLNPHRPWVRRVMKVTLNGHFMPFFGSFGNHVTLPSDARWQVREVWGASKITYRNAATGKAYTVTQSKRKAFVQGLRMAKLAWRFWKDYDALKATWQEAYPKLTGPEFWNGALKLDTPAPEVAASDVGPVTGTPAA